MKNKIIAIFIAVLTIASCVGFGAIGASADSLYNEEILPDLPSDVTYPYAIILKYYDSTGENVWYKLVYSDKRIYRSNYATIFYMSDGTEYVYNYNPRTYTSWVYGSENKGYTFDETKHTLVWSSHDIKNESNNNVFFAGSAVEKINCDGTACPATDINTDNICDDCGKVFAVLRSYDAPDPYTAWTSDRQANFPYAFIYKNEIDANVFIMASTRPYVQDGQIVIDTNGENSSYLKYTQWGNDWRLVESYDDGTTITADNLVSSFNILDTDGNIVYNHDTDFFPVPLWVEMDNLTQGEMVNKFSPTLVGMILTLMVCGVGCLALLVVLKLFGKRSLIFRK